MYDKFIKYISNINTADNLLKEFTTISNIIKNELERKYVDLNLLKEMSYKLAIISDKITDKIESDDNGS